MLFLINFVYRIQFTLICDIIHARFIYKDGHNIIIIYNVNLNYNNLG